MDVVLEWVEYPAAPLRRPDVRGNYHGTVANALSREMGAVADQAAATTPFPRIADSYDVVTIEGATTVWAAVLNDSEIFPFVEEDTAPHFIPPHWPPREAIEAWVEEKGLPPEAVFPIMLKIAREGVQHPGTRGKHYLAEAWEGRETAIFEGLERATELTLERFGEGRGY